MNRISTPNELSLKTAPDITINSFPSRVYNSISRYTLDDNIQNMKINNLISVLN